MEIEYIRDYAMYAAIFGIMSFVWFGWAQEAPRKSWRAYIGIASGIALLLGLSGVYLSVTNWDTASALRNTDSLTTYIIVFLVGNDYRRHRCNCTIPYEEKRIHSTVDSFDCRRAFYISGRSI